MEDNESNQAGMQIAEGILSNVTNKPTTATCTGVWEVCTSRVLEKRGGGVAFFLSFMR